MDLLKDNIKHVYFKYLAAAFGSALISSIYGLVDTAIVGQYQGPDGTAALAVVAPIWNIIYSLGLLTGIGGSVLYSAAKGRNDRKRADTFFTTALLGTALFALLSWIGIAAFTDPLLILFGADANLLPLARQYLLPILLVIPVFPFSQMISAFLRNDNHPERATAAVLTGGIFNIVGDYVFVFALDLGIRGAGIATAGGAVLTLLVMLTHFRSPKNTLRLSRPTQLLTQFRQILVNGFSTFLIDIAMGVLTVLFNRQIMTYLGTDALAVYGVIVNISTLIQCCVYGIGDASQPILSINYGAKQWNRIRITLRYALGSVALFSLIWTALVFLFPNGFIRLFMTPTEAIYAIAPAILRTYGLSFLLLPLNVFSTYYFQSLMKPGISFLVSISRGIVLSGILILLLPPLFGGAALWLAMPLAELCVSIFVVLKIRSYTRALA